MNAQKSFAWLVSAVFAAGALNLSAATIKVDASGQWEGSVATLEEAFAALKNNGDTILVRPGTYYPKQALTATVANLTLKSCDVDGNTDRANTVIDGSSSSERAFYIRDKSTPTIEGLTFRNFVGQDGFGGTLHIWGAGAFKVLDCAFYDNLVTSGYGGAIAAIVCNGGVISNCVFRGNGAVSATSDAQGGAVFALQNAESSTDRCNFYSCTFSNNWVTTTGAHNAEGGAIDSSRCAYLWDCVFEDNWGTTESRETHGGQVRVGCYSRMENCRFSCLNGTNSGKYYGSVVQFTGNSSASDGQGHVIANCTFGPFPASSDGYGLMALNGGRTNTFDNCRFLCSDRVGANIFLVQSGSGATFRNCFFETADSRLIGFLGGYDVWRYENCTFYNKKDDGGQKLSAVPIYVNCLGNYPLTDESYCATNCLFTASIADCRLENPAAGFYYPRKTSAAYDGGFDLGWAADAKDAFDRTRVVGAAVDIGAVERQESDVDFSNVRVVADPAERTGEWATAYTNIQEAVDAAIASGVPNCTVRLKGGTYALDKAVTLDSGAITLSSRASEGGALNRDGVILDGQNACQVLNIDNKSTYEIVVEGLTVRNGNSTTDGGGIYAKGRNYEVTTTTGPQVTIRDCFVTNCVTTSNGGGLYVHSGVVITNCTFVGNTAVNGGGAYAATYWQANARAGSAHLCPCFYGCEFRANVLSATGKSGGGVCTDWSAHFDHCLFADNSAPSGNGGGLCAGHKAWERDCTFVGNRNASYGQNLYINGESCWIEGSSFTGAASGFGSAWNAYEATFDRCAFTNNTVAPFYGQRLVHFMSCLFTGAPQVYVSTIDAQNCTFADGIDFRTDANGKVIANNCLVAGTVRFQDVTGARMFCATNSCFQTAIPTGNANVITKDCFQYAPKFVNKPGDCHVKGSRIREKGVVLSWMTDDSVDLDGNPRLVNREGVANAPDALPDLGCYEAQGRVPGMMTILR